MTRSIRFAVVGLGHFAQAAILPAIHRQRGATITALVSGTPEKLDELGSRYGVTRLCDYSQYEELLASGDIDAVYVALPNDMHADAVIRAANHGVHVLCEKPMATSSEECRAMIEACQRESVRFMIAYRLHFQSANLNVVDLIQRGTIGTPRIFSSVFSYQVKEGNTRVEARAGAGPLYDIGIYCINAARYVFREEPIGVHAHRIANSDDERFKSVEEGLAVSLRFKGGRVANFVCSYGAADRSYYEVVGTEGVLEVENAYEYTTPMAVTLVKNGKRKRRSFRKSDQIAAEVQYFVRCIRNEIEPEPSGAEGLADIHIIEAIQEAVKSGQHVAIEPLTIIDEQHPSPEQEITRPAHGVPKLVGVESASR
jgi:glucose-fructose oxidoreductase